MIIYIVIITLFSFFSAVYAGETGESQVKILEEVLIDNCEIDNPNTLLGGYWYTYNDSEIEGNSIVKPSPGPGFTKSKNGYMSQLCASMSGELVANVSGKNPYIGMAFSIPYFFPSDGISFRVKGNPGKEYIVRLETPEIAAIPEKPFYQYSFYIKDNQWRLYSLSYSQFDIPFWYSNKTAPLIPGHIKAVSFQTSDSNGSVSLSVDDVKFYKYTGLIIHEKPVSANSLPLVSGIVLTGYTRNVYSDNFSLIKKITGEYGNAGIGILYTLYYNKSDGIVRKDEKRTPDIFSIGNLIGYLRSIGRKSVLYIYIDPEEGGYRGDDKINIKSWHDALGNELQQLDTAPDAVFLSSEMTASENGQDQDWISILRLIKSEFTNNIKIGYAMNRDNQALKSGNTPKWFSYLDYIGMTAYFPGTTPEAVKLSILDCLNRLEDICSGYGKRPFISELGWPSVDYAISKPYETPDPKKSYKTDQKIQSDLFKTVLPALRDFGIPVYIWRIEPKPDSYNNKADYTTVNKEADVTVKSFFNDSIGSAGMNKTGSYHNVFELKNPIAVCSENGKNSGIKRYYDIGKSWEKFVLTNINITGSYSKIKLEGQAQSSAGTSESNGIIVFECRDQDGRIISTNFTIGYDKPVVFKTEIDAGSFRNTIGMSIGFIRSDWCIRLDKLRIDIQ